MSRSTPNTGPDGSSLPVVHVAAGVLIDNQEKVLLARRSTDSHQGGLWEFPGGKLEPGEQSHEALSRELEEELGIQVRSCRPLIRVAHRYPDREVILHTWLVTDWEGDPRGREGQPLSWVPLEELRDWSMPAADLPILRALDLPDTYLITPPGSDDPALFLKQLRRALAGGISLIQFRVFGLPPSQHEALARKACRLCEEYGARMLVNSSLELALAVGAHGVHLDRRRLAALADRNGYEGMLLAASCHDASELAQARAVSVDFAVLSPVLPTLSHPDAEVLGWRGFKQLCENCSVPVYALGGMSLDLLEQSWRQGGQGIAGIRGLWPPT
ncbi:Nudix family hydrolase [Thiolapillus sp.]|uniref:Nudix family hydrolase n=1 Tax=Thiolapillus sp. TaxID=2017437 RepID=UPI0025D4BF0B|nr:Nudix family hydrolase [Thiolapillus sp.]